VSDFQKKGALKNIDFAKGTLSANYPPDIAKIGVIKGHVYGLLIKGANKSTVWYNVASFKIAEHQGAVDVAAVPRGREDAQGVRHPGVLDRRSRRLDPHRPVREHLSPPGRTGEVRRALPSHDQVDGRVGEEGPDDDGGP